MPNITRSTDFPNYPTAEQAARPDEMEHETHFCDNGDTLKITKRKRFIWIKTFGFWNASTISTTYDVIKGGEQIADPRNQRFY